MTFVDSLSYRTMKADQLNEKTCYFLYYTTSDVKWLTWTKVHVSHFTSLDIGKRNTTYEYTACNDIINSAIWNLE